MTTLHLPRAAHVVLLSLCLAGCSSLTSYEDVTPEAAASGVFRIETDQTVYTFDAEGELVIHYTLFNDTGQPLYITNASESLLGALYKQVGKDDWVLAFQFTLPDKLGTPLQLASGESYTQRIQLPHPRVADNFWEIDEEDIKGTFQIREQIFVRWYEDTNTGDLLPEEQRVSNLFEIEQ